MGESYIFPSLLKLFAKIISSTTLISVTRFCPLWIIDCLVLSQYCPLWIIYCPVHKNHSLWPVRYGSLTVPPIAIHSLYCPQCSALWESHTVLSIANHSLSCPCPLRIIQSSLLPESLTVLSNVSHWLSCPLSVIHYLVHKNHSLSHFPSMMNHSFSCHCQVCIVLTSVHCESPIFQRQYACLSYTISFLISQSLSCLSCPIRILITDHCLSYSVMPIA